MKRLFYMRKFIQLMLMLSTFYSCIQHEQDFVIDKGDGSVTTESIVLFEGAEYIEQITDSTANIYWANTSLAESYIVYDVTDENNPIIVGIAAAPTTVHVASGLIPSTTYRFKVRAVFKASVLDNQDTNENYVEFTTNDKPEAAIALSLVYPSYDNGLEDNPIIRVYGTKSGDSVNMYTDDQCTSALYTAVAPSGSYTDIQLFGLALGQYTFYASISNLQGAESACSAYTSTYEVSNCPNNYVKISANALVGTTADFCIAKFEMKCSDSEGVGCDATEPALSKAENRPWRNVTHAESVAACSALGSQYHLISNEEWMTTAREIEANPFNWTDFEVVNFDVGDTENYNPSSSLNRGHSNNQPSEYLAASIDDNDSCSGITDTSITTCNSLSWHINKRTHNTSADDIIWDFAGNSWEWVNYVIDDNKPNPDWTWYDLNSIASTIQVPDEVIKSSEQQLTAQINGVGTYYSSANGISVAMRRGGNKDHGIGAGIYSTVLRDGIAESSPDIGFRCAYTIP
jgi:hypothetical protein